MYFSTSIPEGRMSTSITSLYDLSPLSQPASKSDDYSTATCAYPSWPRRPSLHASNSPTPSLSSRSSSPIGFQRQPNMDREVLNAWIPDSDLFPEMENIDCAYQMPTQPDLPLSSPVGSVPSRSAGISLSSMSQREMAQRMRMLEAKRVAEAVAVAREQQRRRRGSNKSTQRRSC